MDKYLKISNIVLVLSHFLIYIKNTYTKEGVGKYLLYTSYIISSISLLILAMIFFEIRLDTCKSLSYDWYLGVVLLLNLNMDKIDLINNKLIRKSLYFLAYGLWILVFIKLIKLL